jgi:hypothetical protein
MLHVVEAERTEIGEVSGVEDFADCMAKSSGGKLVLLRVVSGDMMDWSVLGVENGEKIMGEGSDCGEVFLGSHTLDNLLSKSMFRSKHESSKGGKDVSSSSSNTPSHLV